MGCELGSDLIKVKTFALLHDPAWKPWMVTGYMKDWGDISRPMRAIMKFDKKINDLINSYGGYEGDVRNLEAHEAEAFTIAKVIADIKDREQLDEVIDVVRRADRFASGIDRFLSPGPQVSRPVPPYKLNIFNPDLRYPVSWDTEALKNGIIYFVENLLCWFPKIGDPKLRYNALYATLELLWYRHNPGIVPVADTRVPTHSVFDHLYATSALVNWLACSDRPMGYFVKIDIPGIQDIIGRARKASDLWAGSWIISYLAFKTVEQLVFDYGADVVLEPFMGLNPFFISRLLGKLEEDSSKASDQEYKGAVKRLEDLIPGFLKTPYQPVMPGTIYLMLPPLPPFHDKEAIVTKLKEYYTKAWKDLVDAVKNVIPKMVKSKDSENLIKALDVMRLGEHPLAPLKVYMLDVSRVYDEFIGKGTEAIKLSNATKGLSEVMGQISEEDEDIVKEILSPLFIEYLLSSIEKPKESIKLKVGYGITLTPEVQELTKEKYENKERYLICTSCGILPAAVSGSAGEGLANDEEDLDEREHLCPYCYLKRLVGKSDLVATSKGQKGLFDLLGFYADPESSYRPLFSTSDLANLNLWREILKVVEECMHGQSALGEVPRPLKEYAELGGFYNYLAYHVKIFEKLLSPKRQEVNEAIEALKKFAGCKEGFAEELAERANTFYGIVKGDGDFIGKRVARGGISMSLAEYLRRTRTGFRADDIQKTISNASVLAEVMIRLCLGPEDVLNTFNKGCSLNVNISDSDRKSLAEKVNMVPVTPAYLTALSRALMVTALADSETVGDRGQVVYAGGDDVMFLSPPEDALDLLMKTRVNYWGSALGSPGFNFTLGFHVLSGAAFDALAVYGRSYGLLMAHYKDPVYQLWGLAGELEEVKDSVCVRKGQGGFSKTKDVTVVLGGRGLGGVEDAAIIYNYPEPAGSSGLGLRTLELLKELGKHVRKGSEASKELSSSFIQDWLRFDKDIFAAFPAQSIEYLFSRNALVRDWRDRLKDLYTNMVNMDVSVAVSPDDRCANVNNAVDQRHEIIKAYKFLEV
ncbi:type III-B CRISPR-associated protein Cas10/Cmr2 [Acidilobus sp.]|uniref:type III-B CRISPR-associated protein Cas10/Cmr2 n=1 Tax=Acidilobus sp. TaxID=1872109 RepID=UPI003D04C597